MNKGISNKFPREQARTQAQAHTRTQCTDYVIPATVIATGEKVMVNNPAEDRDNPWGFYAAMWHFTEDGRTFHDDELESYEE